MIKNINKSIDVSKIQPFVKWVGGKRGLLSQIIPLLPKKFNNYFEPFVGGGALFFELQKYGELNGKKVYLFDINRELINAYNIVKKSPKELIIELSKFQEQHSKEFYFKVRAWDRKDNFLEVDAITRASRFIYLNKTCFNGLYRVNRKNQNNVPMGSYKNPNICNSDIIYSASYALQNVTILNVSYKEVLKYASKEDLVYFDPPYYPLNPTSSFTSYSEFEFLNKEQEELFDTFYKLDKKGIFVVHSNSDTIFINELYKDFNIKKIQANRFINSKGSGRGKINELLIRNRILKRDIMEMDSFEDLKNTFQESIFTWNYFTDFKKVKLNVKKVEKELNILNYLIGKDNIENEFIALIEEYPKIREALPLLIAVRKNKLLDTSIITDIDSLISENKQYIFYNKITENIKSELLIFFRESGLKDIFKNRYIKNLVDYCFGVEVGFDTNARKNRTGTLMENIVSNHLKAFCNKNRNFIYIEQATQKRIKESFNYKIEIDKNSRRFDFALYNSINNQLFLIEVNYYSGGGSKLKATAGEYKSLNDFIKSQNIEFIWITDGKGWLTAINSLEETFNHNNYVINLNMIKNGILDKICL